MARCTGLVESAGASAAEVLSADGGYGVEQIRPVGRRAKTARHQDAQAVPKAGLPAILQFRSLRGCAHMAWWSAGASPSRLPEAATQ